MHASKPVSDLREKEVGLPSSAAFQESESESCGSWSQKGPKSSELETYLLFLRIFLHLLSPSYLIRHTPIVRRRGKDLGVLALRVVLRALVSTLLGAGVEADPRI